MSSRENRQETRIAQCRNPLVDHGNFDIGSITWVKEKTGKGSVTNTGDYYYCWYDRREANIILVRSSTEGIRVSWTWSGLTSSRKRCTFTQTKNSSDPRAERLDRNPKAGWPGSLVWPTVQVRLNTSRVWSTDTQNCIYTRHCFYDRLPRVATKYQWLAES